MPVSNDNQDYGQSDKKNEEQNNSNAPDKNKLTSDDLKGKKVDANLENESEKPLEEKK